MTLAPNPPRAAFPPAPGPLAHVSLLAFCSDGGVNRDGVTYRCLQRKAFPAALKLGWVPLGPCGVRDGVTVDLFAWLCQCATEVPA